MSAEQRVVVVVGAGPGVSGSLARRCAADGWAVGLVGNDESALEDLASTLVPARVERRVADVSDPVTGGGAVADLGRRLGRIDLLHVNPSAYREADPLHLDVDAAHGLEGAEALAQPTGLDHRVPGGAVVAVVGHADTLGTPLRGARQTPRRPATRFARVVRTREETS